MIKNLAELGMGTKSTLENIIWEDAKQILQKLERNEGREVQGRGLFLNAANNVVWSLATGENREQDDPLTDDLTARIISLFSNMSPNNPLTLLTLNSIWVTRLFEKIGLPNMITSIQVRYVTKVVVF